MSINQIKAKITGHSINTLGQQLITYELVFPRFLLPEFNTHREFSRNSASSRAIPFKKMVESVKNTPYIPLAFQKHHTGMQGRDYITNPEEIAYEMLEHLEDRDIAVKRATERYNRGVTKQICNRYLEPFSYHKVIMTTSLPGLKNFFELRCPSYEIFTTYGDEITNYKYKSRAQALKDLPQFKEFTFLDWLKTNNADGEIHISLLAEAMWDAYNDSKPVELSSKEWHLPFNKVASFLELTSNLDMLDKIRVATGMCARVSYTPFGDESELTAERFINIYNNMLGARPFHASPFEHCARAMTEEEYSLHIRGYFKISEWLVENYPDEIKGWSRNFKGFKQLRDLVESNGDIIV